MATILDFAPLDLNRSPGRAESATPLAISQTTATLDQPTETPAPTFTPTPTATLTPSATPTPTLHPEVEGVLEAEDLSDHVGQLLMVGISGQEMTSQTCNLIHQIKPGGVILTNSNAVTPWQLQNFTKALRECAEQAGIAGGLLIALDHEGQFVYRYDSGATWFPMAMALGAIGDAQTAYEVAQASGQELKFSGVNTVLGPVADVIAEPRNVVISIRSFGSEPEDVADFVVAMSRGYLDLGLLPALKHFPGLGSVALDPHEQLPVDESSKETIQQVHLPPFERGIQEGIPIVMVSHADYPALDPSGIPSSMSSAIIEDLLKGEMGFEGIVLTDAIEMGAVVSGAGILVDEATITTINAGADMVMVVSSSNADFAYRNLQEAVQRGDIPSDRVRDALRRILSVKYGYGLDVSSPPPEVDWQANIDFAREVGRAAPALVKDSDGLIPLASEWKRILVVCPYWYSSIPTALQSSGRGVDYVGYSVPLGGPVPEGPTLRSLPTSAGVYDGAVLCTYDAYLTPLRFEDSSQLEMVQGFLDAGLPTIVIALKSPYDLLGFPSVGTYLATYGTTPGQLSAVADILLGEVEAAGIVPVDLED